ncbi:bll2738 [Bradyrhizobium diazoefficiens USDA 110]|uniref:Bll2738 protein n=1 Tax=Bradyrhizobium diazoefficiens (strain JCM 10833 / BCRC 13528 / IAM 13628 / NBRC 14792 / USDA 110) TaxID=224911 RepID=Q89RM5_BRADU|nr:hypothetical protein CO678_04220 [Bradyrhizobium diazoefficiens]QBP21565.1 hypothetical protein Bdiaspc4_14155 [Bradyrhizobium diazoefficiens]BAC48003.1 bll2738 [Bradyrhizobium diazoefficiens USDA 110]
MELLWLRLSVPERPRLASRQKGTICRRNAAVIGPGTGVHGRASPQAADWRLEPGPRRSAQSAAFARKQLPAARQDVAAPGEERAEKLAAGRVSAGMLPQRLEALLHPRGIARQQGADVAADRTGIELVFC